MPKSKSTPRVQRFKSQIGTPSKNTYSAAVSIDSDLYLKALLVAKQNSEGNFSRYVRSLIRRDISAA